MHNPKYQWQTLPPVDKQNLVAEISDQCQLPVALANLLVARGIDSLTAAQHFLKPQLQDIADPHGLHDIDAAVERLEMAVANGEKITIYGDYDVDGLTSTALMYEVLTGIGAEVNYYIPNRFTDGYGPNLAAYQRLIEQGTQLILTVDNGISGKDEIAAVKAQGIDVVVTDHHSIPAALPVDVPIVHPQYPGSEYPGGDLSGVGVAFKVAWALLEEFPTEVLDLVAMGELADLVDVTGENRALIKLGLQQLQTGMRPGVTELLKLAKVKLAEVDEQTIGFQLAPRLNALGRLGDANLGVELLTSFDDEQVVALAQQVDAANQERQRIVKELNQQADAQAQTPANQARQTLVINGDGWHQGVLGIVASHVVATTGKPTIVLGSEDGQLAKGSGRGVAGFDLFQALDQHRDLMTSFGGHTMACGLSLPVANLDQLAQALEQASQAQGFDATQTPALTVAATLPMASVTADLVTQIQRLAPFGPGNEEPVFEIGPATVSQSLLIGQDKRHTKLQLAAATPVDVLAFNEPKLAPEVPVESTVKVVGTLALNRWQGRVTPQIFYTDLATTGVQITDARTRQLVPKMFQSTATYVVFDDRLRENIDGNAAGQVVSPTTLTATEIVDQQIIIVDCPPQASQLQQLLPQLAAASEVVFWLYTHHQALSTFPPRSQFVGLYQFFQQVQVINVNQQLPAVAAQLHLPQDQIIFMIQVFIEAGFVIIKDGFLKIVSAPMHQDITATNRYQVQVAMQSLYQQLLGLPGHQFMRQVQTWLNHG
ncbi:single-stranded-DNA-specific exonuclease RecJ [Limosilactobacillus equigenerosi]|uniref:Single-stranded-DNA-specific exonuclease RecJ n=3 Tax=Limosilactobacillus TaxID=2742598 RepID=A0A0R1UUT2_9LACO|nr:single-stranded-DNA-specific exonuclease RecJ [Limosilactobacillus equigenerosi]KRL94786.1 Single-strand DNA-specific exonuclease [Limosilactobacillus equigenerosi DSM 18793 = JCM 14505]